MGIIWYIIGMISGVILAGVELCAIISGEISREERMLNGCAYGRNAAMATVKCSIGKRGKASHEWNDGEKDRIYCMGWVDRQTDDPIPECLDCQDHVSHAQDDLDAFYQEKESL